MSPKGGQVEENKCGLIQTLWIFNLIYGYGLHKYPLKEVLKCVIRMWN